MVLFGSRRLPEHNEVDRGDLERGVRSPEETLVSAQPRQAQARRTRALILAALAGMSACVDGGDPVVPEGLRTVHLAASPVFAATPTAAEAAALTRARVTARDAGTGAIVASVQEDIEPSASEWTLELSIEVDGAIDIRLQVELASTEGAAETVEWSGETTSFELVASANPVEVREVALYRGPLDNLTVTDLELHGVPSSLLEGESARTQVSVVGGGAGARVYLESLTPSVVTVDGSGRIEALAPGLARIQAVAGPVTKDVTFTVDEVVLPAAAEVEESVAPQMDYTSVEVAGTLGDAAGAAMVATSLSSLGSALSSGDGAGAVRAFEEARAAWESYGAGTSLRILDGPQLSLIELTLILAADALGISFG